MIDVNVSYLHAYSRHRKVLRLLREAAAASSNEGFGQLWLDLRGDFVARTRRWLQRLRDSGRISTRHSVRPVSAHDLPEREWRWQSGSR
jgi:hypothetical protein